jgi:hypothetical protein
MARRSRLREGAAGGSHVEGLRGLAAAQHRPGSCHALLGRAAGLAGGLRLRSDDALLRRRCGGERGGDDHDDQRRVRQRPDGARGRLSPQQRDGRLQRASRRRSSPGTARRCSSSARPGARASSRPCCRSC